MREVFGSDESELEFAEFEAGSHFSFKKAVLPALTLKDAYQTLAWYLAVTVLQLSKVKSLIRHSVFYQKIGRASCRERV